MGSNYARDLRITPWGEDSPDHSWEISTAPRSLQGTTYNTDSIGVDPRCRVPTTVEINALHPVP